MFVLSGAAPADMDLTSSIMQKISLLEQKMDKQAQEIQLKVKSLAFTRPVLRPALTVQAKVAMHLPALLIRQIILWKATEQSYQSLTLRLNSPCCADPAVTLRINDSLHPSTNIIICLTSDLSFLPFA